MPGYRTTFELVVQWHGIDLETCDDFAVDLHGTWIQQQKLDDLEAKQGLACHES